MALKTILESVWRLGSIDLDYKQIGENFSVTPYVYSVLNISNILFLCSWPVQYSLSLPFSKESCHRSRKSTMDKTCLFVSTPILFLIWFLTNSWGKFRSFFSLCWSRSRQRKLDDPAIFLEDVAKWINITCWRQIQWEDSLRNSRFRSDCNIT